MPGPLPVSILIPGHAEREEGARWSGGGANVDRFWGRSHFIAKEGKRSCLHLREAGPSFLRGGVVCLHSQDKTWRGLFLYKEKTNYVKS